MYNDVAYLARKVKTGQQNQYGDEIYEYEKKEVFVNVESVTRSEFYTAQTAGYDPQIVFEIADYYDYDGQPFIEYNKVMYKIIRTYRKKVALQIVCQHSE